MKNNLRTIARCSLSSIFLTLHPAGADPLEKGFSKPPPEARPWVYCFAPNGNLSSNAITRDLEAMARVGIGGLLYLEGDQGVPQGPVAFASAEWRNWFRHLCAEARRLGLKVNVNNDAGYTGSGGPWITPELSMQRVIWAQTNVTGPLRFDAMLPQGKSTKDFYRDIAVLAYPTPRTNYVIPGLWGKSLVGREDVPLRASYPAAPPDAVISREQIVNITAKLGANGRLSWDLPEGRWTILRLGHTSTGAENHPAPPEGRGLECDKLNQAAVTTHFEGLMAKLVADNKDLAGEDRTLVSTHIDSWEVGTQNWTPNFRAKFQRLRGYDPLPFLPAMSGCVVDSLETSERFLWDVRQTVNDLVVQNYAVHFRNLAHRHGLRLSMEPYSGPFNNLAYASAADEIMYEFWSYLTWGQSCTEMASAAHVYGKPILGGEAFTGTSAEKWQGHPGSIKEIGDWAFCNGINRFVIHRYTLQPWEGVRPGVAMGPWGLHYERTQTWWEHSKPWHEYIARCQFLLQQGLCAADLCFLGPEMSPYRSQSPVKAGNERPAYSFDLCPPEVVLTRMKVKEGRLVLPEGMSYRMLVLPKVQTMTPRLLGKVRDLVKAGATVVGAPPLKSPSLQNYPECDAQVKAIAKEMWGEEWQAQRAGKAHAAANIIGPDSGSPFNQRSFGKGRVVWTQEFLPPEQGAAPNQEIIADIKVLARLLAQTGVRPDFEARVAQPSTLNPQPSTGFRYIHKTIGETDLYFVANKHPHLLRAQCAFRVQGKRPEFWRPETGRIEPVVVYDQKDGVTCIPIELGSHGSVFVLFRPGAPIEADRLLSVARNGEPLLSADWAVTQEAREAAPPSAAETELPPIKLARGPRGSLEAEVWQAGTYTLKAASGKTRQFTVAPLAPPIEISGSWTVRFDPAWGGPANAITFENLEDWSKRPEDGIRYYSGTAVYRTRFVMPESQLAKGRAPVLLDLGRVAVMAEVILNGKPLGTLWKAPFQVEVSGALKPGNNLLEVKAINLWVNRLIGDEQLPEDSTRFTTNSFPAGWPKWLPEGSLKEWPQWLIEGKPSPAGRYTFASWRLWSKGSPLQESGLLGPVRLRMGERVAVR